MNMTSELRAIKTDIERLQMALAFRRGHSANLKATDAHIAAKRVYECVKALEVGWGTLNRATAMMTGTRLGARLAAELKNLDTMVDNLTAILQDLENERLMGRA